MSYIRVLGVHVEESGIGRAISTFSPSEEELFHSLASSPNVYDRIVKSIAPALSGEYTLDIKKAIACLLFSGSRKVLPDRTRIRGDINVLLMGDPSTAKSQFLKFVEKVAPVWCRTREWVWSEMVKIRAISTWRAARWYWRTAAWCASMSSTRCTRTIAWPSTRSNCGGPLTRRRWSSRRFRSRRRASRRC